MNDKYNIIHKNDVSDESDIIEIINNILYSNKNIIIPSFVSDMYNNDIVLSEIKKYILSVKKNIKNNIKKGTLTFDNLNSQINEIIYKILYIDNIFSNNITKNIISEVSKNLINDGIISVFIEKKICDLNISEKQNISELFKITGKLSTYDKKKSYNKLLSIVSSSIIDKKFNNIQNIINFIDSIRSYYDFLIITDIIIIIKHLIDLLFSKIIDISKENINDVINIFNTNKFILVYIIFHENIYNFCAELITILNNITDCYSLVKVLDIINVIFYEIDYYHKINENEYKISYNRIINILINNMNNIHNYIDSLIKQMIMNDNKLHYDTISQIIEISSNCKSERSIINSIHNKSKNDYLVKFIENYNDLLVKRLLTISYKNINIELYIINNIINKNFDKVLRYNTNKIINSYKDNYNLLNDISFNPSIITYGLLNINYNNYVDKSDINNTLLKNYYNIYTQSNKDRTISWYPQFGEVNITYDNNDFIMLPIHFMILELFDNNISLKITDIYKLSFLKNYDVKFVDKVIESLIKSNIIIINNNDIKLYKSNTYNTNIIEIFNNINNPTEYNISYVIPKKDIICSNINHILKQTDANKEELFKYLQDLIIIFKLSKDDFDIAIEYMIKMDYIIVKDDLICKSS